MVLATYIGDCKAFRIPLRRSNQAFAPAALYNLIWTLKADEDEEDEYAKVQKQTGYGITHDVSYALVSLTYIDTAGGTVEEVEVPALDPGTYVWSIRAQLLASPYTTFTCAKGTLTLVRDISRLTEASVTIYTTDPPAPATGEGTGIEVDANGVGSFLDQDEVIRYFVTYATNPYA